MRSWTWRLESIPGIDRIEGEWESLLGYLADQDAVIVLDEFPYLIDADESLPSVIQRLWDQELRDTGVTLILVGSSISMMEEATLLGNSPLYGRFTEKIDLRQLDFAAARTFFPESYSAEQLFLAWGVFLVGRRTIWMASIWTTILEQSSSSRCCHGRGSCMTSRSTCFVLS